MALNRVLVTVDGHVCNDQTALQHRDMDGKLQSYASQQKCNEACTWLVRLWIWWPSGSRHQPLSLIGSNCVMEQHYMVGRL